MLYSYRIDRGVEGIIIYNFVNIIPYSHDYMTWYCGCLCTNSCIDNNTWYLGIFNLIFLPGVLKHLWYFNCFRNTGISAHYLFHWIQDDTSSGKNPGFHASAEIVFQYPEFSTENSFNRPVTMNEVNWTTSGISIIKPYYLTCRDHLSAWSLNRFLRQEGWWYHKQHIM